jgi:phosphohistidine phosphatase
MIIYFLRHASAGQKKPDPQKDEKRPLDSDGIEQCRLVGRALSALGAHVGLIVSSPLKRASQTASLVGNEIGHEGDLRLHDALRPNATFTAFRELLRANGEHEAIMVVGHNPNLSEFLGRLIGGGTRSSEVELKKGAVAKVEANSRAAALQWLITPKVIRAFYGSSAASSRPKTSRK